MGKFWGPASWILGILAALMIGAAQTSVETATSNLAGWLKLLGLSKLAAVVTDPRVDLWITVIGIAVLLGVVTANMVVRLGMRASAGQQFVPIDVAGQWLYEQGNEHTRKVLRGAVPETFNSISDHGAAFVREAAKKGVCQLYARREVGLSMEPVPPSEAEDTAFQKMFSPKTSLVDVSIKRGDLKKVLDWYES